MAMMVAFLTGLSESIDLRSLQNKGFRQFPILKVGLARFKEVNRTLVDTNNGMKSHFEAYLKDSRTRDRWVGDQAVEEFLDLC